MKFEYLRESFDNFSDKTSDISRQLGLAGIAIVWLFRITGENKFVLPKELYDPLFFLVSTLAVDLLQFIYGTIITAVYMGANKNIGDDDDVNYPEYANIPTWILFGAKILLLIIAYFMLLEYLYYKSGMFQSS